MKALRHILDLERRIKLDVGSCHAARAKTADDLTIKFDADFRRELEEAFEALAAEAARSA